MKNGKETKNKEVPNREPSFDGFSDEFFQNQLSLRKDIKEHLNDKGLDWRFINSAQFRTKGNTHRSHWKPHQFQGVDFGQNVDGYLTRGDLILATREKKITAKHKEFLKGRNERLQAFNRTRAQELKKTIREAGIEGGVTEGYDDN